MSTPGRTSSRLSVGLQLRGECVTPSLAAVNCCRHARSVSGPKISPVEFHRILRTALEKGVESAPRRSTWTNSRWSLFSREAEPAEGTSIRCQLPCEESSPLLWTQLFFLFVLLFFFLLLGAGLQLAVRPGSWKFPTPTAPKQSESQSKWICPELSQGRCCQGKNCYTSSKKNKVISESYKRDTFFFPPPLFLKQLSLTRLLSTLDHSLMKLQF